MKKHLLRLSIFLILSSFLFDMLNLGMKSPSDRWEYFYNLPKNSVDVLFLGNSHNFTSFQPEIIDQIIPVNSYVLGVNAENVIISYYELREALKYQHPKVVVLETYALDLDDSVKKGYIYEFLDSGPWSLNKMAIAARYLTPETAYAVFPALRTRIDWNKISTIFNQLDDQLSSKHQVITDPMNGATPKDNVIKEDDYLASKEKVISSNKQPQADIDIYLRKMYLLCKDYGIKLVLVKVPIVSITSSQVDYYAPYNISGFVNDYQVDTLIFDKNQFNHIDFADSSHPSSFGSIKISIQLARELAQIMNLPVDQDALNYFDTFVFTDYKLTEDNGQYKLELFPSDPTVPLKYHWSIKDINTKEIIYDDDWSNRRTFIFSLPNDGSFHVNIKVMNPEGDYQISAYFSVGDEN
jgi:hypothetical protein